MTKEEHKQEMDRLQWWCSHHQMARNYDAAKEIIEKMDELNKKFREENSTSQNF